MKHAITGAFGYSGRHIAHRLLDQGEEVVTLTNSPQRAGDLQGRIQARPLSWDRPDELAAALDGVDVLHNTYWVRFGDRHCTHAQAVAHTRILFEAARRAGIGRIVHVSIANAERGCGLEYYERKAETEEALAATGLPHSILRPTVLFGGGDILVNNIAWTLRRFPFLPVFGDGLYKLQPIHVDDLAALAVSEAFASGDRLVQAIGPETYTYRALAGAAASAIGVRARIVPVYPIIGYAGGKVIGWLKRDRFLAWDEVLALMGNRLFVDAPSPATTSLAGWMRANAATLGTRYAGDPRRAARRPSSP